MRTPKTCPDLRASAREGARSAARLRREERDIKQRILGRGCTKCVRCGSGWSQPGDDLQTCDDCMRELCGDVSAEEFEDRQRIYGWRGRP